MESIEAATAALVLRTTDRSVASNPGQALPRGAIPPAMPDGLQAAAGAAAVVTTGALGQQFVSPQSPPVVHSPDTGIYAGSAYERIPGQFLG